MRYTAMCDMCLEDVPDDDAHCLKSVNGVRACRDCRDWLDYWESILAEWRARENRSQEMGHRLTQRGLTPDPDDAALLCDGDA